MLHLASVQNTQLKRRFQLQIFVWVISLDWGFIVKAQTTIISHYSGKPFLVRSGHRLRTNFLSILTPAFLWRIPPRCNRHPWAIEWRRCTSCQGYGWKLLRFEASASKHLIIYPVAGSTELAKRWGLSWSWVSFVQSGALCSNGRSFPWPPKRSVFHASR